MYSSSAGSPMRKKLPQMTENAENLTAEKPDVDLESSAGNEVQPNGINIDIMEQGSTKSITKERIGVVISILMTELCERLAYYSVAANLILFCTSTLKLGGDEAANIIWIFTGTLYVLPVFGGYVADSYAGRYNTILGGAVIYVLGLFLVAASAVDYRTWFDNAHDNLSVEARRAYFYLALVFIGIGTAGIKANVGPFGAQQVEDLGPDAVRTFFTWFYWFINAAGVVASSAVAYVQQEHGFGYGFLIPLLCSVIALAIFILSKGSYMHAPPGGSVLLKSVLVCYQSCNGCRNPGWNNAREKHGGTYNDEMVDGVRAVIRIIPIFVINILYFTIYSQSGTVLYLQSERMNIKIGDAKLPVAILTIFNTIIVLVLIPIMDRIVYPLLVKFGKSPSLLQRIGIGLLLVILAMVYAGVLEIYRKKDIQATGGMKQKLADDTFTASQLSMFSQAPVLLIMGAGEVFLMTSGLEFVYSQAPAFMKGLAMGLFLLTGALGSYLSILIVNIVKAATNDDWFPKEPNEGHMEYLLFLLTALAVVDIGLLIIVAKYYKYKSKMNTDNPPSRTSSVAM